MHMGQGQTEERQRAKKGTKGSHLCLFLFPHWSRVQHSCQASQTLYFLLLFPHHPQKEENKEKTPNW